MEVGGRRYLVAVSMAAATGPTFISALVKGEVGESMAARVPMCWER